MSAREQGAQALKSGNPQEAIAILTQAVSENPQDPQAHAYLGTAYGHLNQIEKAVECFGQAARLAPQSAPIRFNLGMALERTGKTAEALEAYREVLKLDAGHERAQQAAARLAADGKPRGAPPAPAPAPAPAPKEDLLAGFAFGEAPLLPAGAVVPPPQAFAPNSPLSAPPPPMQAPAPAPYGAPPPAYGAASAPPPAPMGMQPLGDWTPPPGTPAPPAPGQWQPAPPAMPQHTGPSMDGPAGVVMSRVDNDQGLSKSAFMGNSYLAGMGMGVWWGLIGALVVFMGSMAQIKASELGEHMPKVITLSLMMIALGALAYAVIGLISATTDDPEKFGGIFGIVLGILTSVVLMPIAMSSVGFYSVGGLFGTIWVSWKMGASVGANVAEQQASALVVAGPGGVLVSRTR